MKPQDISSILVFSGTLCASGYQLLDFDYNSLDQLRDNHFPLGLCWFNTACYAIILINYVIYCFYYAATSCWNSSVAEAKYSCTKGLFLLVFVASHLYQTFILYNNTLKYEDFRNIYTTQIVGFYLNFALAIFIKCFQKFCSKKKKEPLANLEERIKNLEYQGDENV